MKSYARLVVALVLLTGNLLPAADPEPVNRAAAVGLQFGPETTVITEPLATDGLPDYLAALNRELSAGVEKDENFWVLMWPAMGNVERTREEYIQQVEQKLGITIAREPRLGDPVSMAGLKYGTPEGDRLAEQQTQASSRPWTRQEFREIARWVDAHAAVLAEIHAACQRPKAYAPLVAGDGQPQLIQVLLPHVQALRSVARLLATRSMLRLSEGDVEGSWQDLVDLQRLAGHSEKGFTLIEALVGYAIRGLALQPTAHWIALCGLSADELAARQAVLAPLAKSESLTRSVNSERYMYLDTVVTLMSGRTTPREAMGMLEPSVAVIGGEDGSAESFSQLRNARETLFQLILLGSDVNETLRYGNAMYNDLVAAMQPATHQERKALLDALDARVQKDVESTRDAGSLVTTYLFTSRENFKKIPGRMLTGLLMPAVSGVETAHARSETAAALLHAAFAVQVHFTRTGEIPVTLSELPPSSTAGWTDPFTGEPLLLKAGPLGLIVYGVGVNARDDGGRNREEGIDCDDLRVILPLAP